ncbi:response regulator [Dyadobacter sp. CY312]|uniref:response regulator n=1 Tax=Dyadobacter sp. CY312 TaxID=2907303 RepID=UPI001F17E60E|nr:response regulator [Dyadobacter sp. CY312]MCE7042828.1 response regulator [Dyadobacter sp. CY312]
MLLEDHILVADGFREILLKILPPESVINVFSSVERATKSLETENYAIITTDLIIPVQNVLSFITTCRRAYDRIIILVISSVVVDANRIKAYLAARANGYLNKAVDPVKLNMRLIVPQR